jgi:hypothetical protein
MAVTRKDGSSVAACARLHAEAAHAEAYRSMRTYAGRESGEGGDEQARVLEVEVEHARRQRDRRLHDDPRSHESSADSSTLRLLWAKYERRGGGGGGAAAAGGAMHLCGAEEVLEILRDVAVAVGRRLCQRVEHLRVGRYCEHSAGLPTATARAHGPVAAARACARACLRQRGLDARAAYAVRAPARSAASGCTARHTNHPPAGPARPHRCEQTCSNMPSCWRTIGSSIFVIIIAGRSASGSSSSCGVPRAFPSTRSTCAPHRSLDRTEESRAVTPEAARAFTSRRRSCGHLACRGGGRTPLGRRAAWDHGQY